MPARLLRPLPTAIFFALLVTAPLWGDQASEARLKRDVTFLASDECEGRGIGTKGLDKASEYIASQFAQAGLKPGGVGGTYFQPFQVIGSPELDGPATLVLHGPMGQTIKLKQGSDFQVSGLSGAADIKAPIVFAGFGATAPKAGYDDYAGIDVKGKIVLVLRHVPRWSNDATPFDGSRKDQHAGLETKQSLAAANGAAALILVNDAVEADKGDPLMPYDLLARASGGYTLANRTGAKPRLPFVQLRRSVADTLFMSSLGTTLREAEQAIDRDLKPRSAPLSGWTASLEVKVKRSTVTVKNVVGVLEGAGPLAKEIVVIGAHYDHLGYGGFGSMAKGVRAIHHGADDNGSGTTSLMEVARHFAAQKDRQGRRLVFIAFSAEEAGLLGSRYYCKDQPLFPLGETVAMVNLDMVGRLRPDQKTGKDKVLIEGSGSAKGFDAMLDKLNPGFQLSKQASGNGPSDHDSFYNQKIPVVFLWTGYHPDYHRPSDTADKINVEGMDRVVGYAEKIVNQLATDPARPEYVAVARKMSASPGVGDMPRLGFVPAYDEDKEGVGVDSVSAGGPAEKGGLKAGDLIVAIGGRPVTSMNAYMTVMRQQVRGRATDVTVMRNGKKVELKLVPQ